MSTLRRRTTNPFMTISFSVVSTGCSGGVRGEVHGPWRACPTHEIISGTPTQGRECSVDAVEREAGVNHGGQPHEAGGDERTQEANGKSFHDKLLSVVSTGCSGRVRGGV